MSDRLDRLLRKKEENQKLLDRIQESIDDNGELSEWEADFLDSILEQVETYGKQLTDRQVDKLEQIEFIRAEGRDAYWREFGDQSEY